MNEHDTILTAGCKVNLYLDITGRRQDGYHELRTLFWPLPEPADRLLISAAPAGSGLTLACDRPELAGEGNILAKAWRAYGEATGYRPDLKVRLEKNIPMGAGLGGGSSDAAVFILYLNDRAGAAALAPTALRALAARLGADVPFFLLQRPAWASGIGERLTPSELDLSGLSLVLLCPDFHVSTPWAYRAWDEAWLDQDGPGKGSFMLTSNYSGYKKIFCPEAVLLSNSFESVVFPAFPELRRLKEKLYRLGAAGAVMSGSGASLCALFRDGSQAEDAAREFQRSGTVSFVHHL